MIEKYLREYEKEIVKRPIISSINDKKITGTTKENNGVNGIEFSKEVSPTNINSSTSNTNFIKKQQLSKSKSDINIMVNDTTLGNESIEKRYELELKKQNMFLRLEIKKLKCRVNDLSSEIEDLNIKIAEMSDSDTKNRDYILALEKNMQKLESEIKKYKKKEINNNILNKINNNNYAVGKRNNKFTQESTTQDDLNMNKERYLQLIEENSTLKEFKKNVFEISKNYNEINKNAIELILQSNKFLKELSFDLKPNLDNTQYKNIKANIEDLIELVLKESEVKNQEYNYYINIKEKDIEKNENTIDKLNNDLKFKDNIILSLKNQIKELCEDNCKTSEENHIKKLQNKSCTIYTTRESTGKKVNENSLTRRQKNYSSLYENAKDLKNFNNNEACQTMRNFNNKSQIFKSVNNTCKNIKFNKISKIEQFYN